MVRAWDPPAYVSLEFDSRQVIEGMDSLAWRLIMSDKDFRAGSDASHDQLGV